MYTSPRTSMTAGGGVALEPQRHRLDGADVGGDILAGRAVAPGGGAGEPVAVDGR